MPCTSWRWASRRRARPIRDKVREALEDLKKPYAGLIKTYDQPFTYANHDALGPSDYIMVRYEGDKIVPMQ